MALVGAVDLVQAAVAALRRQAVAWLASGRSAAGSITAWTRHRLPARWRPASGTVHRPNAADVTSPRGNRDFPVEPKGDDDDRDPTVGEPDAHRTAAPRNSEHQNAIRVPSSADQVSHTRSETDGAVSPLLPEVRPAHVERSLRQIPAAGTPAAAISDTATSRGGAFPAAAFRNPFRQWLPEIVFFHPDHDAGGRIVRLMPDATMREGWGYQVVSEQAHAPTAFVTTTHRGCVQAFWTDRGGLVRHSLLTAEGFSAPVILGWASRTDRIRATYYLPTGTGSAEPVLYGTRRVGRAESQLWIRTQHDPPAFFSLPAPLRRGADFVLSMTGHRSWVIDAAEGGYLRRWDGRVGDGVHGLLTYTMAGLTAEHVFGGCGDPQLYFPQPQFIAQDGLAYLWHPQTGAVPCTTAGPRIVRAMSVGTPSGDSLVYLASHDGRLSVTRQVATAAYDPHWGGCRVISREIVPHTEQLVPLTHPNGPPAVFTLGSDAVTLYTPGGSPPSGSSMAFVPWEMNTMRFASRLRHELGSGERGPAASGHLHAA